MIEVELKFQPNVNQKKQLIKDSTFLKEESFIDIYYDTNNYELSGNDIWLRSRNGVFMLKTPVIAGTSDLSIQHNQAKEEITDLATICEKLHLNINNDHEGFAKYLLNNGIKELYSYRNNRIKYKCAELVIDFDYAKFNDDFHYELCEIEIIVNHKDDIPDGIQKIKDFAYKYGMEVRPTPGKLITYIKAFNQEHYAILKQNQH